MHVMAVLDAMKKRGHFNDYDRAQKAYEEATKVAELAEAGLALLKWNKGRDSIQAQEEGTRKGQGSRKGSPCKGP